MIEAKGNIVGKVSSKQSIKGQLNNAYIYPTAEQLDIMPSSENQEYVGLYNQVKVSGDSNLLAENIKSGVSIFGVEGEVIANDCNAKINPVITSVSSSSSSAIAKTFETLPLIDVSAITDYSYLFSNYSKLKSIEGLIIGSSPTKTTRMYQNCSNLTTPPTFDMSQVTNSDYMYYGCKNITELGDFNTINATSIADMFASCSNLTKLGKIKGDKLINVNWTFSSLGKLVDFEGVENIGMAYDTSKAENYSNYSLELNYAEKLSQASIAKVVNNLYDIKSKGCNPQKVAFRYTVFNSIPKEVIAMATEKGWNVTT